MYFHLTFVMLAAPALRILKSFLCHFCDIFSQHILVYIHTTVARSYYLLGTARYSFYTVLYCSAES